MKEPESHRHHYIPEFYLKGFTASEGHFYVFDKQTEKLKKAYPSQYFFGWDRNTGEIGNEKSTLLEYIYAYFENIIAPHYEVVKKTTDLGTLNMTSFFHVLRFIHLLYWRVPENESKLEKLIDEKTFSELGFDIVNKTTGESAADVNLQNELRKIDAFRKMYRIFMPLLSSKEEYLKTDYENWQIYTWTEGNNLTGDFPIILDKFVDFSSLNEELIFPLAKNKILVHTKRTKPLKLASEFKIHLDMLILQQATRYVCCADKTYLELLQKELYSYSKNYDFKSRMKDKLFGYFA